MKSRHPFVVMCFLVFVFAEGCVSAPYGTARYRDVTMAADQIVVPQNGMSREQVDGILSTKFPPKEPVSISLFFLAGRRYYGSTEYDPVPAIIKLLDNSPIIHRIVPIPKILMPSPFSIDGIQQVGIRSLSEYSLLLFGDSDRIFFSYKSPLGSYMVSSTLEFLLIDNRTTAIIASDKLFSEFQTPTELFTDKEYQLTLAKMYVEQAKILDESLTKLFARQ